MRSVTLLCILIKWKTKNLNRTEKSKESPKEKKGITRVVGISPVSVLFCGPHSCPMHGTAPADRRGPLLHVAAPALVEFCHRQVGVHWSALSLTLGWLWIETQIPPG